MLRVGRRAVTIGRGDGRSLSSAVPSAHAGQRSAYACPKRDPHVVVVQARAARAPQLGRVALSVSNDDLCAGIVSRRIEDGKVCGTKDHHRQALLFHHAQDVVVSRPIPPVLRLPLCPVAELRDALTSREAVTRQKDARADRIEKPADALLAAKPIGTHVVHFKEIAPIDLLPRY